MLYESTWTSGGNNWKSVVHQSEMGGTTTTVTDLFENGHIVSITKNTDELVAGGWVDINSVTDFTGCEGTTTTTYSHGSF